MIAHKRIEEEEWVWLQKLKDEIEKIWEKVGEKEYIDTSFYNLKVSVEFLNPETFEKEEEITLIEPEKTFCRFCGRETRFYEFKSGEYMCPACYAQYKEAGERLWGAPPKVDVMDNIEEIKKEVDAIVKGALKRLDVSVKRGGGDE